MRFRFRDLALSQDGIGNWKENICTRKGFLRLAPAASMTVRYDPFFTMSSISIDYMV
jgi:hypothetical protein